MKNFLIFLAIVLPLGFIVWLILWAKDIWDKIKFTPYFVSADFKGLNLKDVQDILASGQTKQIDAVLGMEIINESNTPITFSGLKAKLYYKGILIAETSPVLANQKFTAQANNVNAPLQVTDSVTVTLSQATANLLAEKLTGTKPKIDYTIEISIYSIPVLKWFPIRNSFEW